MFQIIAFSNGIKLNHTSRNKASFAANFGRIRAADALLDELRGSQHAELVLAQEDLINAYIALADLTVPKSLSSSKQDPNSLNIKTTLLGQLPASKLQLLPICTATIPVRHDCDYSSPGAVVAIYKWDSKMEIATSGVNRPFVLQVLGTDGHWYKQLVKSADDLRQDAVMEQLFALVNQSLLDTPEAARRNLCIRTYNVVPLTPCVGVVGWVLQTSPLQEILVSKYKGVHHRYRPASQQRSCMEWMVYMKDCHVQPKQAKGSKLERYFEACADIPPAFRHFFLENFPSPVEWFAKRLSYTRSMAVNSIVGYIVGLGDRHNNNILLDKSSAEVVHIDLGVAFDLGKVLKTPEIVPFRLTRDLVDGMGITGVEGVYRRCCEETMRVLRSNQVCTL